MSILDFNRRTTMMQTPADQRPQRDPAQFWLNVGYYVDMPNATTGEPEQVFISLPFGIPLDTMTRKPLNVGGFRLKLATGANNLLDDFLELANSLEPGEARTIDTCEQSGLVLEIRRVKGVTEMPEDEQESLFKRFKFV